MWTSSSPADTISSEGGSSVGEELFADDFQRFDIRRHFIRQHRVVTARMKFGGGAAKARASEGKFVGVSQFVQRGPTAWAVQHVGVRSKGRRVEDHDVAAVRMWGTHRLIYFFVSDGSPHGIMHKS
jgi:hypothetical protein